MSENLPQKLDKKSSTQEGGGSAYVQKIDPNVILDVLRQQPLITRKTKIEEYNLEEVAWELFWHFSKNTSDIAHILNEEFHNRKTVLKKRNLLPSEMEKVFITQSDVSLYLRRIRQKIDEEDGKRFRRQMRRSYDTIRQLETLLTNIYTHMDYWSDVIKDRLANQTPDGAIDFYKLIQNDRAQLISVLRLLPELKSKIRTQISYDLLQSQINKIMDVILSSETMEYEHKDKMLIALEEVIDSAKDYEDEDIIDGDI